MPSTIGPTPVATTAAYGALASALKKRIAAGTFSGFTQDETDALADIALGITEKNGDPLGAILQVYENPRAGALEAHYVPAGSLIGG